MIRNLICLYTSHADLHLADQAKNKLQSVLGPSDKIITILSKDSLNQSYVIDHDILYVKTKECYSYLNQKTLLMIQACFESFKFKYLVKWDVSSLIDSRCVTYMRNGNTGELFDTCIEHVKNMNYTLLDQQCYWSHLKCYTTPEANDNWMIHEKNQLQTVKADGRQLCTSKAFTGLANYYKGKFYVINNKFADFIVSSEHTHEIVDKMFEFAGGSEDVTIGLLYDLFAKNNSLQRLDFTS